ncbi:hypothetical protein Acy02nite_58860 [Actinoplanes cyaneus]|uniref:Uncharacterized protein n=1 Tax=Actinoplanes cyaneus TaxID=52696 RepID=A0A919ITZ2_9ACTN|nr:hypothetical protein Acy02nite_58860 [Actinoplanes cyaneus]
MDLASPAGAGLEAAKVLPPQTVAEWARFASQATSALTTVLPPRAVAGWARSADPGAASRQAGGRLVLRAVIRAGNNRQHQLAQRGWRSGLQYVRKTTVSASLLRAAGAQGCNTGGKHP